MYDNYHRNLSKSRKILKIILTSLKVHLIYHKTFLIQLCLRWINLILRLKKLFYGMLKWISLTEIKMFQLFICQDYIVLGFSPIIKVF